MHDGSEGTFAGAAPSGRQLAIVDGDAEVVVTEVGAGLRAFSVAGEPVVWPYPVSEMAGGGRGQVLAPWPNRIEDGTYSFGAVTAHAPLDEPDRHNAIHGLVRWLVWDVEEHSGRGVSLRCELAAQPAYPWRASLRVAYELRDGNLLVEASAENCSTTTAPFGMGFHPYLHTGASGADGCRLTVPAGRHLLLDERGIPSGSTEVEGTAFEFAAGRSLSGVRLDDCFTDLEGSSDGLPEGAAWEAVLAREDGRRLALWADSAWPYVMCYTGDTLAGDDRRRGVAIEPMTCPPNAFRTGDGVVSLEPGERWSGRFGIRSLTRR